MNHANKAAFFKWVNQLNEVLQLELKIDTRLLAEKKEKEFSPNPADATFLLELATRKKVLSAALITSFLENRNKEA